MVGDSRTGIGIRIRAREDPPEPKGFVARQQKVCLFKKAMAVNDLQCLPGLRLHPVRLQEAKSAELRASLRPNLLQRSGRIDSLKHECRTGSEQIHQGHCVQKTPAMLSEGNVFVI